MKRRTSAALAVGERSSLEALRELAENDPRIEPCDAAGAVIAKLGTKEKAK